jgi:hypothetical protein
MSLDHAEKVAGVLAAVIAAVALMVTAIFSYLSLDTTRDALTESRSQGWGVLGAQNCADYRAQVQDLWERKVPEDRIRAWFAGELGGAHNPYVKGTSETALEDNEGGCGDVKTLAAILKAGRPAGDGHRR